MNLNNLLRATIGSAAARRDWITTRAEPSLRSDVLLGKPAQLILMVICLTLMPLVIPSLGRLLSFKGQIYRANLPNPRDLISFRARTAPANVIGGSEVDALDTSDPAARSNPTDECVAQLIDDPAHALDHFYASLVRTDAKQGGAITRITHYGDSPITNDGITGTARRLMQERFGDAGHGFILIDRPWAWYSHQAITFTSGGGWTADSFMNPSVRDGAFGLGGVTFRADGPGRYARYAPALD